MNQKIRKYISLFLSMLLLLLMTLPVAAATPAPDDQVDPMSSAYISITSVTPIGGNGQVKVNFSIVAKSPMVTLGATKVEIKNSSGTVVKTFSYTSTGGMIGYYKTAFTGSVTYTGATSGAKYYAVVTFKATNTSGSDTRTITTGYVTAT